ncbi:MAG: hypothetical protein ABH840_02820 [Nanoarchaeota archaeon]
MRWINMCCKDEFLDELIGIYVKARMERIESAIKWHERFDPELEIVLASDLLDVD